MRILSTLYDYNDATTKRFMPSDFSAEADVNTQKNPKPFKVWDTGTDGGSSETLGEPL